MRVARMKHGGTAGRTRGQDVVSGAGGRTSALHRRARRQPSTAVQVGVQRPRHGEREREGHEGERDERRKKTGVIWSITKKNIEQVSSGML